MCLPKVVVPPLPPPPPPPSPPPISLDSASRPVPPPQGGLAGNPQAFPLASQGFRGDAVHNANRMDPFPKDKSSLRLYKQVLSRRQGTTSVLSNSQALHKDRFVMELSPETANGLWSTFFPVLKNRTSKMHGCINLCKPN